MPSDAVIGAMAILILWYHHMYLQHLAAVASNMDHLIHEESEDTTVEPQVTRLEAIRNYLGAVFQAILGRTVDSHVGGGGVENMDDEPAHAHLNTRGNEDNAGESQRSRNGSRRTTSADDQETEEDVVADNDRTTRMERPQRREISHRLTRRTWSQHDSSQRDSSRHDSFGSSRYVTSHRIAPRENALRQEAPHQEPPRHNRRDRFGGGDHGSRVTLGTATLENNSEDDGDD